MYDLLKARAELLPATAEISGASSTTTHLHAVDNAVKTGLVSARLTPLPPGSTCLDGHPDCASNAGILTPALLALLLVTLFTALLGILTVGFAPRRRAFGQVFVLVSIVVAFYAITRTALAQATGLQAVSTLTSTTTWFGTTTTTVTIADLQSSVATPVRYAGSSSPNPAGSYGSSAALASPTGTADGSHEHANASAFHRIEPLVAHWRFHRILRMLGIWSHIWCHPWYSHGDISQ